MGKFKWSLLHDIGYVYFVIGVMAQSKEKMRQVRIDKVQEKILEWPSEGNNNENILKEVKQRISQDMEDSMDPVLERLQTSIGNIIENLSENNIRAIIDDLLSIVNAASPSDVEINQINSLAEQMGVKPLTKQKAQGKSEQSSADDEPWTLLHDMCYLYYIVAMLPILQGSKDAKKVKLRIDAGIEKILEWPSSDVDGEQLVKKVSDIVSKALSSDGIIIGDKIKELAAKIKKYMPEENYQSVIEDLQYIVNKWSPNKANDTTMIKGIAHMILDDGGAADEETVASSTADKGVLDSEHICEMAYVYFDVITQNQEQNEDDIQAKVSTIYTKLLEWTENIDQAKEIIDNSWSTFAHDRVEDVETYQNKIERYVSCLKESMSEKQLAIMIGDLLEIVDSSENDAHKAELSMIKELAEIFGLSLEVDQHDTIEASLVTTIKSTKDCLTQDTDPPYPGQFCIPGTLYEGRFSYMPFPKVVGKSTKYKADDLFRRFTSDEVSKIVSKIETENKIPYLVFVKEILDSKMNLPNKAPYWFMPFVIAGRNQGVMLYFDQDGFWNNRENPKVLKQCSPAEMIDSIEIEDGHFNDFVMEPFKKDMPSMTVDEGIISTMRVSCSDKERTVELDIAEMHGKGYGPQLEIIEAIWNIWKDVVEESREASSYMYDPAIFKAFHSWQEVIDWAYESEEKSPREKKSKETGKVKTDDDIDARDEDGKTALIRAAEEGDTKTVEMLLDRGADIEAKIEADDEDGGHRALHYAASEGYTETVELLLNRGADIEAKTNYNWTPLMRAAWSGHKEAVGLLLDKGADIKAEDDSGWRALHYAAVGGHRDVVEMLLDRKADTEAKTNGGETALSLAARNGHTETVELLLNRGADVEVKNNEGNTALMLAEEQGETEVVKCFKKFAAGRNNEAAQNRETMQKQETKEQADVERTQEAASKTEVQMKSNESKKEIGESEKLYSRKVMDALADGVITDLEKTGLDFFQKKLKLSDDDTLRIFEEVLAEIQGKPEGRAVKTRIDGAKKAVVEESMPEETGEEDDGEVKSSKKRITYPSWEEFEKEQGGKDVRKKANLPIANKIHDLIITVLEENNIKYEIRYGDGTFSFSMPKEKARSGKKTFARVGLVDVAGNNLYLDTLYKGEDEAIPAGGGPWSKKDKNKYQFTLNSLEDFENVRDSIKKGVLRSYQYLAR